MFAKCRSNSRVLEPLSALCLTSPRILRDRIGSARTYILPMQRNLDLSSVAASGKVTRLYMYRYEQAQQEIPACCIRTGSVVDLMGPLSLR